MSFTQFQISALNRHNELRAKHSAPPLVLDQELCVSAQKWADTLLKWNRLQHSTDKKYGENLYYSSGMAVTGAAAVDSWYSEIKDYRHGEPSPSNFSQVGHFTQVVWKSTRKLGVGFAQQGSTVFVVCTYDPRGNMMGTYPQNISIN
ncbi:Golgi-associated plant pathogenesis-related protein 1 [Anopheles nili]|uniref:Golgi-associated plant pathogenesis-related protein 1 n=1 Tax=Anopheles nili TaxID=185578 RepID=UPI00237B8F09|nr:Golgi-associated plant pathogenesis-related protein 1 [Anopheles nili]